MNIKQIIFFNITVSLIFSAVMGFFILLINVGFVPNFFTMWLNSTGIGFAIAVPVSFIFIPPIQKITMRLFNRKGMEK